MITLDSEKDAIDTLTSKIWLELILALPEALGTIWGFGLWGFCKKKKLDPENDTREKLRTQFKNLI